MGNVKSGVGEFLKGAGKGLLINMVTDATRAFANMLLAGEYKDYQNAMGDEEAKAREGITVYKNN